MKVCPKCKGAIGEMGKLYGYAGKWCQCFTDPIQNNLERFTNDLNIKPNLHHKYNKTPLSLNDKKGFNSKDKLKNNTWYLALVAYSSNNPYHFNLYYSGFNGKGFSRFISFNAPDEEKLSPLYVDILYEIDFMNLKFKKVNDFSINIESLADLFKVEKE